jgi:hypothetical protein
MPLGERLDDCDAAPQLSAWREQDGSDFTRHQHTRPAGVTAGGPDSRPSPNVPYDHRLRGLPPQHCSLDEPISEVTNDICIGWTARSSPSPLLRAAASANP